MPRSSSIVVLFFILQCIFLQSAIAQKLIPMGHTVEVQMFMEQYYVTEKMLLQNGDELDVNDEVVTINTQKISAQLLQHSFEKSVALQVKRGKNVITINCTAEEWSQVVTKLSNVTDGIGTLTYVTADLQHFGALGHQIQLKNNGQFQDGFIHLATIQSVVKSEKNTPGYKIIHPTLALERVGRLTSNNSVGVFGAWQRQSLQLGQPMETGVLKDVTLGQAQILTQVTADKVQSFTVQITEIKDEQIYFTVKDVKLLQKTGGIIQGMSGSPLIQNNRFIGAVTHMFVENPKNGVAITIHEMLKKSNL